MKEVEYREGLAAAYSAEAGRFHRVAAGALISAGYHDPVHSASDVVNQAIVSLLEHPVERVENYAALITAAIRKRAIDLSRSASSEKRNEQTAYVSQATEHGDEFSQVEDAIDAALAVERIRDALDQLDVREREVVIAVAVRGEAQTVVAARLGITKQRVGQIYSLAKTTLRQAAHKSVGGTEDDE